MQLWFAHGSAVSIREQLVTQVILGVLSDDLQPGQRLPSTRELARRFRVHANTISAGYRQLERERWVEFRRGSGVYVRANKPEVSTSPARSMDQLVADLFRSAQKAGVSLPDLRARLRSWLELQPPDHFLLVEPDPALRAIIAAEIRQVVTLPVESGGIENLNSSLTNAIPVVLPNRVATVRPLLPSGAELLALPVRSVPTSLGGWLPAPTGMLVGIASSWPGFLKTARTVLSAAGFHRDTLVFRDASQPNWQRGLKQTAAVVCDTVTAKILPSGCRAIPFALLSEAAISELRRYQAFVTQPLEGL